MNIGVFGTPDFPIEDEKTLKTNVLASGFWRLKAPR
jgi:sugar lactone lactonase YvrE